MKNLATPSIPDISINKDLISRLNLHPTNFGLFDNFDVFYILRISRFACINLLLMLFLLSSAKSYGQTEITRWYNDKSSAISITYDGGTINQFRVALPIMNKLNLPATFYIVTGDISDSQDKGEFIGRDVREIIKESKVIPVNKDNFFERASAIRYAGSMEARLYHTRAGDMFELGKFEEAYRHIQEAYDKINSGEIKAENPSNIYDNPDVDITWGEIREIARQGHEFGSHTVTHPQLAIYDNANLLYELEKSKEEILKNLGPVHTFSAECPHGTENKRVMEFAYKLHPALRNRMPEPFLEEINRWNRMAPGTSSKEYVQWQRGPKTSTSLDAMNAWVDTCLAYEKVWLVLTFHGVDGIGYEPKTGAEISGFFNYIKRYEDKIWTATFMDAVKYIRERMYSSIRQTTPGDKVSGETASGNKVSGDKILVELNHTLDKELYDHPLTLKTYIPKEWAGVSVKQGDTYLKSELLNDSKGRYILYNALPNSKIIKIEQR
ncbi:MAG: hypothetical protein A2X19_09080 [Bacteroidetes bacterium GWE2_39_28]|nr:MAG: hypothetical protein A2X19_09080 [Bacteroidetes bacterium GWE2_39_28]OFY12140.1 MAG: hypothetical protein A2X16_06215 [Bacteroidetes bacterium GWF2_39_10]OFZ07590.1 MAG: hypothetical protein A2322_01980 [Bacteroidetes bacterium RIFOXYB2_FULL_39_7]OFZ10367.1 MAG: hypothetical protein A2465_02900 [Bacteroidetes bacterium RIFOXYC2_FULL_39_11]HCT94166.1 polysaccharide deacetylase [Rikenellaceae bacterium]